MQIGSSMNRSLQGVLVGQIGLFTRWLIKEQGAVSLKLLGGKFAPKLAYFMLKKEHKL